MKKSVYSLVLSDTVINEIDKAAYNMNTSRSNLINQILADYVSYVTPEKRMQEVFNSIEALLDKTRSFQIMIQPSDSMFSLRSALDYKYNPTVRYSVELYKDESDCLGELRVTLRSQNTNLILCMVSFFNLWSKIEYAYTGKADYICSNGKYIKKLRLSSKNLSNNDIGKAIAAYIDTIDKALKTYFTNLDKPTAASEIEKIYTNYLKSNGMII